MEMRSAGRTDVGQRRKVNEDRYAIAPELGLYLVADGMGGHTAGQVASKVAAESVLQALRALAGASQTLSEKLRAAVSDANREIFETAQAKPEFAGMGTTLVALLAGEGRVALAHVGDSRAYLVRGKRIRQLTDDHSLVAELVRRRHISELAARDHPHRHVLTRALGVQRAVDPDLVELTPTAGDTFLLCSDGLTGHVDDAEIAELVSAETDVEAICDQLVALANDRGGEDNITVVQIRFEKDGAESA